MFSVPYCFFALILAKNQNCRHNAGMNDLSQTARALRQRGRRNQPASELMTSQVGIYGPGKESKDFLALGVRATP